MRHSILFRNAALALLALFAADASAVTMSWSPVGNPGNSNDGTGYGAVGYSYNIGTYDVTNSQYVEFLNDKDPTGADTLGLYNSNMSNTGFLTSGGINFNSAAATGSKYSVISGNEQHPVNYVSWYDSIRFANWMNNGQGNGDTETGAYTLSGGTATPSNGLSITRNAGAPVFLPSENEWYKAAYYNHAGSSYFANPTSTNTSPTGSGPTALPNHANYFPSGPGNLTDVGAYTGTTSPYGAFDMGGNVFQWNEALIMLGSSLLRGSRGGSFVSTSVTLNSVYRNSGDPSRDSVAIGFRLANIPSGYVPEPSSLVLAAISFVALAAWRLRRR